MRVSDACRGDGATHCRSQPANVERMLDKFSGAGAHQIYRQPQIVFAAQNHDGEAKLAVTDFFDQRPDSDTRKVHWRDDASACAGAELGSQLLCTIEGANVDLIGRQGLRDPAPLVRQGCNDVDDVAQWAPRQYWCAVLSACRYSVRTREHVRNDFKRSKNVRTAKDRQ